MKKLFTTLFAVCLSWAAFSQKFQVDTLYKSGSVDNRINVVILGDGFTAEEMPKFAKKAKDFADYFLDYQPYTRYRNYFNFFAIQTPSNESGVSNPGTAPDVYPEQPVGQKDTFYGATFGAFIHRLVTITKYEVKDEVLAVNFPSADLVVVLVNTTFYGGSGGSIAVHTLHDKANGIGVHEIGHTFSHLNDEYWAGPGYGWEAPNMTANNNPATIKWKNWLNEPDIGIYKVGFSEEAQLWHKPASGKCLMEYLIQELCAVCREATTETILQYVNPVEGIAPDTAGIVDIEGGKTFSLGLLKPNPNTLRVKWSLDGKIMETTGDHISLTPEQVAESSTLIAMVFDSTALSRKDSIEKLRTRMVKWSLKSNQSNIFRLAASTDTLCVGGESILTTSGCQGTVTWSGGETAKSITVRPDNTTSYSAYCKVEGAPTIKLDASITVHQLPAATASNNGPYFEGSTIQLTASGGVTYAWAGPLTYSANTASASIPDAKVTNSGIYEVKVTDVNGCSKTVQTEVKVDPILAVGNQDEEWVKVSPNPARDHIKVETRLPGISELVIYDNAGRKLSTQNFEYKTEIKLNAGSGLYLYRFVNGQREVSGKVIVQ
jgi:hypothetical protein